jgi:hypothetical protein
MLTKRGSIEVESYVLEIIQETADEKGHTSIRHVEKQN